MGKTPIQWCDHSINPFRARNIETGKVGHFCVKISAGCRGCYSSKQQSPYLTQLEFVAENRPKVELFLEEKALQEVLRRKIPTRYFWCDMTDMFWEDYPDEWIDRCFAVMALTPHHTHMVLTKRPERMLKWFNSFKKPEAQLRGWICCEAMMANGITGEQAEIVAASKFWRGLPNIWLGVSVEDQKTADARVPLLLQTPAAVRFVSAEPLLDAIDLSKWLIGNKDFDPIRNGVSSVPSDRRVFNRPGRSNLETPALDSRQSQRPQGSSVLEGDTEPTSGVVEVGRLSDGDVLGWQGAPQGVRSQDHLDGGESSRYSAGNADQPHRWDSGQHKTKQFGVGDTIRECHSRHKGIRSKAESSAGRNECGCESNAGSGHQDSISGREDESVANSKDVRSKAAGGIVHFASKELETRVLNWIIVGGESGPGARPFDIQWARNMIEQCAAAGVACFVKQLGKNPQEIAFPKDVTKEERAAWMRDGWTLLHVDGGSHWRKYLHLKDKKGGDMSEWPADLRVRQFPEVRR